MTKNTIKLKFFDSQQITTFKEQGFLVVPQMYNKAEIEQITVWVNELQSLPEIPGKYMMYFENSLNQPKKRIFSRIENFCPYHAGLNNLINGEAILQKVSELFGERAILFKEKVNFKMPGSNGFTPHQDAQAGWNTYGSLFITVLITIDQCTIENGCLELAPGFNQGLIGELWQPLTEENMQGMEFIPIATKPGDVIFFDSYAPHRSAPNLTSSSRRVLYLTYNLAVEGDFRSQYYTDKRQSYPPDIERQPGKDYVFKV